MEFSGIIVPIVTPLNDDECVNVTLLQEHLKWILEAGVHGVLVGGSMGEYPSLEEGERRKILETVCQVVAGKVTLIFNISDASEKRVVRNLEAVEDLPVDAYILTPPYYFAYTWSELRRFFYHVADRAGKPILVYNIPEFAGNKLSADLVIALAEHPYISGLKDSSGDFHQFATVLLRRPNGFSVFQGFTELSVQSLLLGCNGIISGLSNIVPERFVRLFSLVVANRVEEAKALQLEINRINRLFVEHGFISAVKFGLSVLGLCTPRTTRPFLEVSSEGQKAIETWLKDRS